ncbi:MAG: nucleotidyltransferase domain-containing protein [Streptosporangiales bacterium]|nr:nucleotidyltransferase domain-containing protein [Streptosporangiales bacterium]
MFTVAERARVRDGLVELAREDPRITGAALTGSGASRREDEWSDIDLALCLARDARADEVVADWTRTLYERHGAVHHVDITSGDTLFRAFLLASTLQVDVAFWAADEFGPTAPTFRLLFGTANEQPQSRPPDAAELVGTGWLYALHARSSLERGRVWQAEYMIGGVRDHVLALQCLRHGVPIEQGRGIDQVPADVTAPLAATLVASLDDGELRRAFRSAVDALLAEAARADPALATRLTEPLRELAG